MGRDLLVFLIFSVPFLNIVLLFKWDFSRWGNINKRNLSWASLVIYGVEIIIYIFAFLYMTGVSGH